MSNVEKIYLSWNDVDSLISRDLVPRLQNITYNVLIAITRGGIVPGGMIAEQLGIQQILVASVDFYEDPEHNLDWPVFMQFPSDSLLRGQQVLIVDDVWYRGLEVLSVTERVEQAGGRPTSVVLHYKPKYSQFEDKAPNFYAAQTDDWIIYPWEVGRNFLKI
ncbi:MAG: phosphoribosyltransferase [Anaerolineae bacterium]|nr:phosphoribosyltransferase [Anaerolineae bacterium]